LQNICGRFGEAAPVVPSPIHVVTVSVVCIGKRHAPTQRHPDHWRGKLTAALRPLATGAAARTLIGVAAVLVELPPGPVTVSFTV
jgi:hypothetical protein